MMKEMGKSDDIQDRLPKSTRKQKVIVLLLVRKLLNMLILVVISVTRWKLLRRRSRNRAVSRLWATRNFFGLLPKKKVKISSGVLKKEVSQIAESGSSGVPFVVEANAEDVEQVEVVKEVVEEVEKVVKEVEIKEVEVKEVKVNVDKKRIVMLRVGSEGVQVQMLQVYQSLLLGGSVAQPSAYSSPAAV